MIFWTIQHKRVLDTLDEQGVYYPDFNLAPQTHRDTYDKLLNMFNTINGSNYMGLLFCLMKDIRDGNLLSFNDEKDFREYMSERPKVVDALNNGDFTLFDDNHFLCRFETDKFNKHYLCPVDFWTFIMMTPDEYGINWNAYESCRPKFPSLEAVSYEEFVAFVWEMMRKQKAVRPLMSTSIFQANIPFVEKDMLKGVYSLEGLSTTPS